MQSGDKIMVEFPVTNSTSEDMHCTLLEGGSKSADAYISPHLTHTFESDIHAGTLELKCTVYPPQMDGHILPQPESGKFSISAHCQEADESMCGEPTPQKLCKGPCRWQYGGTCVPMPVCHIQKGGTAEDSMYSPHSGRCDGQFTNWSFDVTENAVSANVGGGGKTLNYAVAVSNQEGCS